MVKKTASRAADLQDVARAHPVEADQRQGIRAGLVDLDAGELVRHERAQQNANAG